MCVHACACLYVCFRANIFVTPSGKLVLCHFEIVPIFTYNTNNVAGSDRNMLPNIAFRSLNILHAVIPSATKIQTQTQMLKTRKKSISFMMNHWSNGELLNTLVSFFFCVTNNCNFVLSFFVLIHNRFSIVGYGNWRM